MSDYLIWSNEYRAWLGPGRNGYAVRVEHASRYTQEQALRICTDAMSGRRGDEALPEIPVWVVDIEFMLRRFTDAYPGVDPEPAGKSVLWRSGTNTEGD